MSVYAHAQGMVCLCTDSGLCQCVRVPAVTTNLLGGMQGDTSPSAMGESNTRSLHTSCLAGQTLINTWEGHIKAQITGDSTWIIQ